MIFTTDNSIYEIDPTQRRIRRLEGRNQPTPRQGDDGGWKDYADVSDATVGSSVLVIWRWADGIAQGTCTSPVRSIVDAVS